MFRCDICYHQNQEFKRVGIFLQDFLPALVIHIGKVDLYFFPDREIIGVLILHIEVV